MKQIFKVLSQSEAVTITKQDGTVLTKSTLVLQEPGGKYENSYVCALLGPQYKFTPGDVVIATLHFSHHEKPSSVSGQSILYQDVTIQEIIKLGA